MRVGIVGLGVVGSAVKYGLEKLGHDICAHDIKLKTSLVDVLGTEICFLCLPTPSTSDGTCDTSIVEEVVKYLCNKSYSGIISIKSTVTPGTTQMLLDRHPDMNICFVPEFLRERCAYIDFVENHDICIIGTTQEDVYKKIKKAHGHLPSEFKQLSPTEAELSKYFNNIYNATLITFANSFYEVCQHFDADYMNIKNAIVRREHIHDIYLDCNRLRGVWS